MSTRQKLSANCASPRCSLCGMDEGTLHVCAQGFICAHCLDRFQTGRDATAKAARAQSYSMGQRAVATQYREWGDIASAETHESQADEYAIKAGALSEPAGVPLMALGEAIPVQASRLVDTLKLPGIAARDASAHRLELLGHMGNDCTALALDAADSISAGNSLEKMLAHQLAVAHKSAMTLAEKGAFQPDAGEKARMLNIAGRMMQTYQRGLLTLERLRNNDSRYVDLTEGDGSQAVVIVGIYKEE